MIRVDLHHVTIEAGGPDAGHRISLRFPAVPRVGESIEFGDGWFEITRITWVVDEDALIEDPDGIPIPTYYVIATVK